jgi:hypothetical protein
MILYAADGVGGGDNGTHLVHVGNVEIASACKVTQPNAQLQVREHGLFTGVTRSPIRRVHFILGFRFAFQVNLKPE